MAFSRVRDEVELFYTDEGAGEVPMLFVHGWGCDSHDWGWQLPYFTQRTRVIAVDLRGHGASTVTAGGYQPRIFAEDVALLLRDIGVTKVVGVGHSLGGLVLSALAIENPRLVEGVVALDPSYGYAGKDIDGLIAAAQTIGPDNAREVAAAVCEFADGPTTPEFFRTWHRRRMLTVPGHVLAETLAENWIGPRQFGQRPEAEAYLDRRTCPSLTIYTATHTETTDWASARARKGLDEVLHLPLGHWGHQEMPALYNAKINAWAQQLPR